MVAASPSSGLAITPQCAGHRYSCFAALPTTPDSDEEWPDVIISVTQLWPTLIICCEDPLGHVPPHSNVVRDHFAQVLSFPSATLFIRWLFMQDRGDILPRCVLLTGWRQARSCAAGIAAARGQPRQMRADDKRPALSEPLGDCAPGSTSIRAAVGYMLVRVSPGRQKQLSSRWASEGSVEGPEFYIASSDEEVAESLANLSRKMTLTVTRFRI
mmetsp:Transcript_21312/g.47075  ORF Transcript_21312/g.47075 Transcript_21312/m.47075 type:complete len:214 (-) Transcript_21312:70-711(-)